jgi:hypothetical protein
MFDSVTHEIPDVLADMPPGPELGAALALIEVT